MYQPVTLESYGGLNEDENPSALKAEDLRDAFNVCRLGNLTGTRPGLVRDSEFDADIDDGGTETIQGIHEYREGRDENRKLVVVCKDEVYASDDATPLTKSGATITAGAANVWTFAHFQNLLWAAGGAQGTDSIWSWDGSGNVTGRLSGLSLDPIYVYEKWNTLFLGGFKAGTDAWNNPLVGRYNDYAEDATDEASWPNSNSIPGLLLGENSGPGSYGNEYNTGFGSYQDNNGDFLLFLTNRRIVALRQNPNAFGNADRFVQTDAIATGCVGQRAFVDLGLDQSDAIYISDQGIHSMALAQQYGNRINTFLTWPIRKTWETINRNLLDRFCGSYWPSEGLVLFGIATGSNTHLNKILALDLKGVTEISPDSARWFEWNVSAAMDLNYLNVARDPDGIPRIYCGGLLGEVAHFSRSAYSDLGAAYTARFRGKDEDFGAPYREKAIGDTFLMVGGSGTYSPAITYVANDGTSTIASHTLRVALPGFTLDNSSGNLSGASTLDNAEGTLDGAGTLGGDFNLIRDQVVGYGSAQTLSHQFSHSGTNEPFWIGQITQEIAADGLPGET